MPGGFVRRWFCVERGAFLTASGESLPDADPDQRGRRKEAEGTGRSHQQSGARSPRSQASSHSDAGIGLSEPLLSFCAGIRVRFHLNISDNARPRKQTATSPQTTMHGEQMAV